MEKIVIFDWGGIIESHRENEYNIYDAFVSIVKRMGSNLEREEIIKKYNLLGNINGISIGAVNDIDIFKKWFQSFNNDFNIDADFEMFKKIYQEEFSKVYYYQEVVDYIKSLKSLCKIGILSNLNMLDKERLDKQVVLSDFDYVWLSFELGCRKPDSKIYQLVSDDLKMDSNNILFIDDTIENLAIPEDMGWNTCHAKGYELDIIKEKVNSFLNEE